MVVFPLEKNDEVYNKPKEILVNDTIGFIRDLPPGLIQAFASTLEDSIESNLLLHVIDASDPKLIEKIKVVDDILSDIKATQKKLYVFNKTDMLSQDQIDELRVQFLDYNPIFISTYNGNGVEDLKQIIAENV
jgi:GTP-binding protein HflX